MRLARKGFTLVEIIVCIAILVIGVAVLLGTFTMDLRQETQTREALLARLTLESLVEEVEAHHYGEAAPERWAGEKVSYMTVVEGRNVESVFTASITTDPKLGNGSFVGGSQESLDQVKLQVDWAEASAAGASSQQRSLVVFMTVAKS